MVPQSWRFNHTAVNGRESAAIFNLGVMVAQVGEIAKVMGDGNAQTLVMTQWWNSDQD